MDILFNCNINSLTLEGSESLNTRGGNRVGFGFGSDGSDQFDILEEIVSGQVGSDQFTCCVFSDR
jgi:hypothetical protein